ncbi:MAG: hypothetical protein ACSHXY_10305 [Alphaproteobacteria bacterium]
MISSLASQNSIAFAQPQMNQISSAQSDALKNVLSKYDANNISEADAKNIVKDVKDLGIASGRPLTIVFAGQGFDAGSIGEKAGASKGEKPSGPPPGGGKGGPRGEVNTEAVSALTLLLEAKDGEDVTETEWSDFYAELEEQGVDTSKPFIDLKM